MKVINRRRFLAVSAIYGLTASAALTKSPLLDEMIPPSTFPNRRSRSLEEFRRRQMSDTDLLLEAAASGEKLLVIPPQQYRLEETIVLSSGVTLSGYGDVSSLRLEVTPGGHAIPVLIAQEGARDVTLQGFLVDGNGAKLSNPIGDVTAVGSGSAVVVCAGDSLVQNLTVKDAWDNGIVVLHARNGKGKPGHPNDVRLMFNRTENCGVGYHEPGGPGQIGSGVNNASGGRCMVIGHHDRGSRGAVTVDDGGGASGFALGCISMENAGDARVGAGNPTEASRGTGTAFYSGNPDWSFDTCKAYFPRKHGFWLAAPGGMQARGCEVIGAQEHGYYLSGPSHNLSDCRAKNVSQKKDNTYSGFFVDTPFGNADGIVLDNCVCEFDEAAERKPKYGYEEQSVGNFRPSASIRGGRYNGKTAGLSSLQGATTVEMAAINDTLIFEAPELRARDLQKGAIFKDGDGFLRVR